MCHGRSKRGQTIILCTSMYKRLILVTVVASASCCLQTGTGQTGTEPKQLDVAFRSWQQQQRKQELMQRAINRMSHPDILMRLSYEGNTKAVIFPGSATTDDVHDEAVHVHGLDVNEQLTLLLDGAELPLGIALSESPLANTHNLEVLLQRSQDRMKLMVNRLAHPDVPVRLVYNGNVQPTVLPGSATTNTLASEAIRLYKLDADSTLTFSVKNGAKLPLGIAISESPLANTSDLDVLVAVAQWWESKGVEKVKSKKASRGRPRSRSSRWDEARASVRKASHQMVAEDWWQKVGDC